jgi:hypothetical protein
MASSKKKISLDRIPTVVLMNYYQHQYERMGKLEDQRLAITNITITLSVLSLTFGFNSATGFSKIIGYAVLVVMALANAFAILYILVTRSWISTHEMRAKGVLERRAKSLYLFDQQTYAEYKKWAPGRWKIQMYLHILLIIVAAAIFVFLYLS